MYDGNLNVKGITVIRVGERKRAANIDIASATLVIRVIVLCNPPNIGIRFKSDNKNLRKSK